MRFVSSEFFRTLMFILWFPKVAPYAVQIGSYINSDINKVALIQLGILLNISRISEKRNIQPMIIIESISVDLILSKTDG
jgi:hypothetical protein